jgi:hypothetical protein
MTTKQVEKIDAKSKADAVAAKKEHDNKRSANNALSASLMGAVVTQAYTKNVIGEVDLKELSHQLGNKTKAVQDGDMKEMEAMLVGQAQSLQTIFNTLAYKASNQTNLTHYNAFLTMALKAQSQSRSTIQALIELKYPKQATFVKQANITTGNQQVNNGNNQTNTREHAHVKEISNQPNELLENQKNEWLDRGTKSTASGINQNMATVEALDRR